MGRGGPFLVHGQVRIATSAFVHFNFVYGTMIEICPRKGRTDVHHLLEAIFILVVGVAFTYLMKIRPGAQPMSRAKMIAYFVLGVVIGVIFITTDHIYAPTTGL